MHRIDRRTLLKSGPALLCPLLLPAVAPPSPAPGPVPGDTKESAVADDLYPTSDPALVREIVGVSHSSLAKVTTLVESHPTLARASWDWGFGDWETALGAASHTGQREIARFLIAKGAPPTLFSATMLGQLDVVKAVVSAFPGVEQVKGPHGIPLIEHARAGGVPAAAVVAYLEPMQRSPDRPALRPLTAEEVRLLCGKYIYGKGPRDLFEVTFSDDRLGVIRPGGTRRFLFHRGDYEFYPSGAESVSLQFTIHDGRATALTIHDPQPALRAIRG